MLWTCQTPGTVECPLHLGFRGPLAGGKHQFVVKGELHVRIPNPHREHIGKHLIREILRESGIEISVWEEL